MFKESEQFNNELKLTQKQKREIRKVGQKYNLTLALIFGSQMKHIANQESDLDIGILDSKPENYKRFGELYSAFSNIFKGYNVDVRFLRDAEPVFLYQVFKGSQLVYGEPQIYKNYKAIVYKRYFDNNPLFDLKERILLKNQKELEKIKI